jgi:hypothetical protein
MFGLSGVGIGVAVLLWITDIWLPRTATDAESATRFWGQVREVVADREILLAAVIFGLTFGPLLAYSDLWAIPTQMVWGDSAAKAVAIAGMIPIGLGVGSLVIGVVVGKQGRPRTGGASTSLIGFLAMATLLFAPRLPVPIAVKHERVQRLMRQMGLQVLNPRRRMSRPGKGHRIYPYLRRDLGINHASQVWAADVCYVPMAKGFIVEAGSKPTSFSGSISSVLGA